jgi:hypothetical protein
MEEIGLEFLFPELKKTLWKTVWPSGDERNHGDEKDEDEGLTLDGHMGLTGLRLLPATSRASRGSRAERSGHGERNEGGRRNRRKRFREKKILVACPYGTARPRAQGRDEVAASQFDAKPRVLVALVTCRYTNICINTLLQNKNKKNYLEIIKNCETF